MATPPGPPGAARPPRRPYVRGELTAGRPTAGRAEGRADHDRDGVAAGHSRSLTGCWSDSAGRQRRRGVTTGRRPVKDLLQSILCAGRWGLAARGRRRSGPGGGAGFQPQALLAAVHRPPVVRRERRAQQPGQPGQQRLGRH